jgi:hypothetical protein
MKRILATLFNIFPYGIFMIAAVASRLVDHPWNVAPITAIALVGAIYLPPLKALSISLGVRFISDLFIGFFSFPLMVAVYACHAFGACVGVWVRRNKSFMRILIAPAVSATLFFLVTNFAFLYSQYPHTIEGVMQAYMNGLPFFRGTLTGDMFYVFALIGCVEGVRAIKKKLRFRLALSSV